jgi:hypothetical protein
MRGWGVTRPQMLIEGEAWAALGLRSSNVTSMAVFAYERENL